jgi:carbon monoxide dehydrogenase subunit G
MGVARLARPYLVLLLSLAATAAGPGAAYPGGAPVVQVSADDKADASRIRASIDIAAPPAAVWGVLIDCARAPQIIPNLESCKVIRHDPGGRWDVREHVINPSMLPRLRTVVRNTFEVGQRLSFKRISGDMRVSQGEWRLEPSGKGTRLSYDALIAPDFFVPQFMIAQAVQQDFPIMLRAIERASIADTAKR